MAFWAFFGDGYDGGVAVDGCAGGEDDVFAAVFLHDVDEYEDAVHVCFVVCQWLGYGFAYCFESGKVDDGVYLVFCEDFVHCFAVADVGFDECYFVADDFFDAAYCFGL